MLKRFCFCACVQQFSSRYDGEEATAVFPADPRLRVKAPPVLSLTLTSSCVVMQQTGTQSTHWSFSGRFSGILDPDELFSILFQIRSSPFHDNDGIRGFVIVSRGMFVLWSAGRAVNPSGHASNGPREEQKNEAPAEQGRPWGGPGIPAPEAPRAIPTQRCPDPGSLGGLFPVTSNLLLRPGLLFVLRPSALSPAAGESSSCPSHPGASAGTSAPLVTECKTPDRGWSQHLCTMTAAQSPPARGGRHQCLCPQEHGLIAAPSRGTGEAQGLLATAPRRSWGGSARSV